MKVYTLENKSFEFDDLTDGCFYIKYISLDKDKIIKKKTYIIKIQKNSKKEQMLMTIIEKVIKFIETSLTILKHGVENGVMNIV